MALYVMMTTLTSEGRKTLKTALPQTTGFSFRLQQRVISYLGLASTIF